MSYSVNVDFAGSERPHCIDVILSPFDYLVSEVGRGNLVKITRSAQLPKREAGRYIIKRWTTLLGDNLGEPVQLD
jgi:hypothetical protein